MASHAVDSRIVTKFNNLFAYVYTGSNSNSGGAGRGGAKLPGSEGEIATAWTKMEDPFSNTVPIFRWPELLGALEPKSSRGDAFEVTAVRLLRWRFGVITVVFNALFSSPIFPFH